MSRRTLARSQATLVGGTVARLFLALGVTVVVGRSASPDAFGFFSLVGSLFFVARVLLDLGTSSVAVREIARDPARELPLLEGLWGWRRLCGTTLAALVAGAACFEPDLARRAVLLGVALALALMGPGALAPVFQLRQVQGPPTLARTTTQAGALAGALGIGAAGATGAAFAWLHVARELVNVAWIRASALRLLGARPRPGLLGRGLGPFFALAAIQGLAMLLRGATFHLDVFVVHALRGEAELGAYAAAYRPVQPLLLFPALALAPLLPVLSARGSREPYDGLVRGAATALLGVGALLGCAGALTAPALLELVYGSGTYVGAPLDATSALRWMALALAASFASAAYSTALLAAGGERRLLVVHASALALNLAGNLALVPAHGFTAAAGVTAATELAAGVALFACVRRGARRPDPRALVPALALAVALAAAGAPTAWTLAGASAAVVAGSLALVLLPQVRALRAELLAERGDDSG